MNDDLKRNQILAIVLSLAVLMAWQFFFAYPAEKARREQARLAQEQAQQQAAMRGDPAAGTTPGATAGGNSGQGAAPAGNGAAVSGLSRSAALALSPRIAVATPELTGSIALKGGRVDDLVFTHYDETVNPGSAKVVLLSPAGSAESYFADFGWVAAGGESIALPNRDTLWTQVGTGTLSPTTPVTLTWDNGQGLVFRRTIAVDAKYMFTVKDEVENKGSAAVNLQPYGKIYRLGTPKTQGYAVLHEGLIGVLSADSGVGLQEVTYSELAKEAGKREGEHKSAIGEKAFADVKDGWLGFTDKYWAAVLVPPSGVPYTAHMDGFKAVPGVQEEGYQADDLLQAITIAPGATQGSTQRLFAGAKEVQTINGYGDQGIKRFDLMIDWGWFHFIAKPMFYLIEKLYRLLGNFGLAILAVTVLMKGLFLPLQNLSYASMAKMKKLQPEMERLKVQFKDAPERQREAMMKLYQEHKVNPASGCLPMLLQFPVFFALYKVLVITIDMRHAKFFGWIRDLSAPDPSNIFNLFGLIPVDPTHLPLLGSYLHMGFWPLVMGLTMWMTMQMSPQQADPTQQQIMSWMPVLFTFTMAGFPAGLVIYWAWSNLLSLGQQYYIMTRHGAEIHLWRNIGIDRWLTRLRSRAG